MYTVGKLFVVPTPVGNMEDMTFRAVRVLKEADSILAEVRCHFEETEPLGEIVIIVAGKDVEDEKERVTDEGMTDSGMELLMGKGKSKNKYKNK